ncbi:hypothetical protein GEMRC1_004108 [Eukaryota sp. GEM-RC1]
MSILSFNTPHLTSDCSDSISNQTNTFLSGILQVVLKDYHFVQSFSSDIIDLCLKVLSNVSICLSHIDHQGLELGDFSSFRSCDSSFIRDAPHISRTALQILYKIVCFRHDSPLDQSVFQNISNIAFDLLSSVRHVGVLYDSATLLKTTSSLSGQSYRQSKLNQVIDLIVSDDVSHRRRSAGVPTLVSALLHGEVLDNSVASKATTSMAMSKFLTILNNSDSTTSQLSNCFNVFTSVLNDLKASSLILDYLDDICPLIVNHTSSESWDCRSASARCMAIISTRFFGSKGTAKTNFVDLMVFTERFSKSFSTFLNILQNFDEDHDVPNKVLSVLSLLQRMTCDCEIPRDLKIQFV